MVSQTGKYSECLVMTQSVSFSLLLSIAHHNFGGGGGVAAGVSREIATLQLYMILVEPLTMEPRIITTPPPPRSML